MRIGEKWVGNHQHLDAGNFQLYYKGILASESGATTAIIRRMTRRIIRRRLHITRCLFTTRTRTFADRPNAGGQRRPTLGEPQTMEEWSEPRFETGKVLAHAFGLAAPRRHTRTYTGDIAKAYSDKAKGGFALHGVSAAYKCRAQGRAVHWRQGYRSFAGFQKTFCCIRRRSRNCAERSRLCRTQMRNTAAPCRHISFSTKDAELTKIGGKGKEFTINGENYPLCHDYDPACALEAGAWRLENSPKHGNNTDYMLTVLLCGRYRGKKRRGGAGGNRGNGDALRRGGI